MFIKSFETPCSTILILLAPLLESFISVGLILKPPFKTEANAVATCNGLDDKP